MRTKDHKLGKAIEAGKLAAILDGLPPEFLVSVNKAGNLNVHDGDERLIGFVDLAAGDWTDFRSPAR